MDHTPTVGEMFIENCYLGQDPETGNILKFKEFAEPEPDYISDVQYSPESGDILVFKGAPEEAKCVELEPGDESSDHQFYYDMLARAQQAGIPVQVYLQPAEYEVIEPKDAEYQVYKELMDKAAAENISIGQCIDNEINYEYDPNSEKYKMMKRLRDDMEKSFVEVTKPAKEQGQEITG